MKRNELVQVKVTSDEKLAWKRLANLLGVNLSSMIRLVVTEKARHPDQTS